ncbi:MAG: AAA family ATPase [Pseudomonadota bacterium]
MKQETSKTLDAELFGTGFTPSSSDDEVRLLADLWRALWRAKYWLALGGFVAAVIAYAMTYTNDIKYTSVARVMIETRTTDDDFGSGLPISVTVLESELEVLRSQDLAERVVERLDLETDDEFAPTDEDEAGGIGDLIAGLRSTVRGLFQSDEDTGETTDTGDSLFDQRVVANVVGARSIEQVGNASAVFAISFRSESPRKAARLANALAEEYLNSQTSAKLTALERSQGWLSERTIELQERLVGLGVDLERQVLDAPFTVEETETMKAQRTSAERQLNDARNAVEELTNVRREIFILVSQRNFLEAARAVPNPSFQMRQAMIEADNGDPNILEAALTQELNEITAQIDARERVVDGLRAEIDGYRDALVEVAEHDAQSKRIESDIRVSEAIYQDFVSQLSRRTQQDRFLNPDARIIAYARPSLYPSEPKRALSAVVAAVIAVFLLSLMVLVRELNQSGLRTVSDYEEATGLPVLGTIPRFSRKSAPVAALLSSERSIDPRLIQFARKLYSSYAGLMYIQPHGSEAWGQRGVPAPLETDATPIPSKIKDNQIIACASALDGEGKSSTMLLLAGACAYAGEKVLLIDADFWDSPLTSLSKTDAAGYLRALDAPDDAPDDAPEVAKAAVQALIVQTDEANVSVLPAPEGLEDPAAVLLSEEFAKMVQNLSADYDRILIDTPAVLKRVDIAALYRVADTVLLITNWNATPRGAVKSAIKALQDVGVTPSAVAATKVNTKRASGYGDNPFAYAERSFS